MKIKGRCTVCAREMPADLLITGETAGRCPFCGTTMDAQYNGNFVTALANVQIAGTMLEGALEQLGAFGPKFDLDEETLLASLRAALAERSRVATTRETA